MPIRKDLSDREMEVGVGLLIMYEPAGEWWYLSVGTGVWVWPGGTARTLDEGRDESQGRMVANREARVVWSSKSKRVLFAALATNAVERRVGRDVHEGLITSRGMDGPFWMDGNPDSVETVTNRSKIGCGTSGSVVRRVRVENRHVITNKPLREKEDERKERGK
jgi:hypothetical protein